MVSVECRDASLAPGACGRPGGSSAPDAGQGVQAQGGDEDGEGEHGGEVADVPGCDPDADDGDDQSAVQGGEVGGDDVAAAFWRGEAVGGGEAAEEDGADGDSAHDRPGQEQGQGGLGEGGDDEGQRGQEHAKAGQHDPAATEPGQQ